MAPDEMDLAKRLSAIARALLSEDDVETTLKRITEEAVDLIDGCESAGIDVIERGEIRPVAPTSDIAARIDAIQVEVGEGPCLSALREHQVFSTDDLATESRWPAFAQRAHAETGIRSMMGFRLFADEDTMGALDLYSSQPNAFDERTEMIGSILAAHAAVALSTARTRETLEEALSTRDIIGQAKGLLMARHGVDAESAFAMLREVSQRRNIKLREVAETVVANISSEVQ